MTPTTAQAVRELTVAYLVAVRAVVTDAAPRDPLADDLTQAFTQIGRRRERNERFVERVIGLALQRCIEPAPATLAELHHGTEAA